MAEVIRRGGRRRVVPLFAHAPRLGRGARPWGEVCGSADGEANKSFGLWGRLVADERGGEGWNQGRTVVAGSVMGASDTRRTL